MRAPVKHPLTFLRPQHLQHPRLTANHNSGSRFDPDHSESGRLFKPARSSIQQDSVGINPNEVKDGRGAYYVILHQDKIEVALTEQTKELFKAHDFEIQVPIEYNALRSVIIRHIDRVIEEYEDEEIVDTINKANSWAEVEGIVRLANAG